MAVEGLKTGRGGSEDRFSVVLRRGVIDAVDLALMLVPLVLPGEGLATVAHVVAAPEELCLVVNVVLMAF